MNEIVAKPAKIETVLKLDLACGQNKKEGFVGVDIGGNADIIHNLNRYPWPFDNDSVEEINCSHFIEHVDDLIRFMDECWRVMKPGAKMNVVAPYYSSIRAMQDPTHKHFISEMTFMYFNRKWREMNKIDHYPIKSDFDFSYGYALNPPWNMKSEEARNFAIVHYINVIADIQVNLTKREPEPTPPVPPVAPVPPAG
jgi:SAM-dependent methyltransferase